MSEKIVYKQSELEEVLGSGADAVVLCAGIYKIPPVYNVVFKRIGPVKVTVDCTYEAASRLGMVFENIYPAYKHVYGMERCEATTPLAITSSGSYGSAGSGINGSGAMFGVSGSGSGGTYYYEYEYEYGYSSYGSGIGSFSYGYSLSGSLGGSFRYGYSLSGSMLGSISGSAGYGYSFFGSQGEFAGVGSQPIGSAKAVGSVPVTAAGEEGGTEYLRVLGYGINLI